MALVKQDNGIFPSLLSDFFDIDRFFDSGNFGTPRTTRVPAANISENDREFHIELAVPGMTRENMSINVENNVLTITGEKKEEKDDSNDRYTRREYSYNSFVRSFQLPDSAKPEEISAGYKDGVLSLTIPKREQQPENNRRQISIS